VASVTAVFGFIGTWFTAGRWTAQLAGALGTIVIQQLGAYIVSNDGRFTNAGRAVLRRFGAEPRRRHLLPTTKWWIATIIASVGFVVTPLLTGRWTRDLTGALIVIAGQRLLAYIVPNADDDGD
jgi:hypothetical protein